jgi:anti-anti-sigma factor
MARFTSPPISVSRRGSATGDPERTVVWVRGEHDIATKDSLVVAIAYAGQLEHADVFVDLSELTFMDASTIGAIIGSANRLRSHSQSLALRAPSPWAFRVLDLCGLAPLVHPAVVPAVHQSGVAAALSTSIGLPPGDPTPRRDPSSVAARRDVRRATGSMLDTAGAEVDPGGP